MFWKLFSFQKGLKKHQRPPWLRRRSFMACSSDGGKGQYVPVYMGPASNLDNQLKNKLVSK